MVKSLIKRIIPDSWLEERAIRLWYQEKFQAISSVESSLDIIEKRWNLKPTPIPDQPIFIFSAEWRAGSTLLQRLVNSDQRVLIWGEPYHKGNFVQCLSDAFKSFTKSFPQDECFIDSQNFSQSHQNLSHRWTANLYPEINTLIDAQRAFFKTLYAQPAMNRGFERWGVKEVRLSIDHAHYLKWLFPEAKFLFLYRNPYKAYMSCHTWRDLYLHWPQKPLLTPEVFGTCWQEMVQGYRAGYQKIGGKLIKYESFCQGDPAVDELADYLELKLDSGIMNQNIGSQSKKIPLTSYQIRRLRKVVEPLASELGYTGLD